MFNDCIRSVDFIFITNKNENIFTSLRKYSGNSWYVSKAGPNLGPFWFLLTIIPPMLNSDIYFCPGRVFARVQSQDKLKNM